MIPNQIVQRLLVCVAWVNKAIDAVAQTQYVDHWSERSTSVER